MLFFFYGCEKEVATLKNIELAKKVSTYDNCTVKLQASSLKGKL
jgi:hypothetical protein